MTGIKTFQAPNCAVIFSRHVYGNLYLRRPSLFMSVEENNITPPAQLLLCGNDDGKKGRWAGRG